MACRAPRPRGREYWERLILILYNFRRSIGKSRHSAKTDKGADMIAFDVSANRTAQAWLSKNAVCTGERISLMDRGELASDGAAAQVLQGIRHLRDDLDQRYQFLPKTAVLNRMKRGEKLARLVVTALRRVNTSANIGEQTAKDVVYIVTLDHGTAPPDKLNLYQNR
jgi:hypothetical protein